MDFTEQQPKAWEAIVTQMVADKQFYLLNRGSVNGPGSSLEFTRGLREELPELLRCYTVNTMVDAPCGDMTWMSQIDLSFLHSYVGYDVEARIIQSNQKGFGAYPKFTFIRANLLTRRRFPKVDLILCRDFLSHLTTEYITVMLDKFTVSGSKYLLASNYPGEPNEFDYQPDVYPWLGYLERTHDLEAAPFNMERLDGIPEARAPGGILHQKHELALFRLN